MLFTISMGEHGKFFLNSEQGRLWKNQEKEEEEETAQELRWQQSVYIGRMFVFDQFGTWSFFSPFHFPSPQSSSLNICRPILSSARMSIRSIPIRTTRYWPCRVVHYIKIHRQQFLKWFEGNSFIVHSSISRPFSIHGTVFVLLFLQSSFYNREITKWRRQLLFNNCCMLFAIDFRIYVHNSLTNNRILFHSFFP